MKHLKRINMKTIYYTMMIVCAGFALAACSEETKDVTGPSIQLEEPTEDQPFTADGTHEVHIEFDLADESGINEYTIEIHYADGGHSHAPQQAAAAAADEREAWSYKRVYADKSGQKNAHVHVHSDVIPANARLGDYHLGVIATDVAGNESQVYCTIELVDYLVEDND
jgi:hypothetical protein